MINKIVQSLRSFEYIFVVPFSVHIDWAVDNVVNSFSSELRLLISPINASFRHLTMGHQVEHGGDPVDLKIMHILDCSKIWASPDVLSFNFRHAEIWNVITITLLNMAIDDVNVTGVVLA